MWSVVVLGGEFILLPRGWLLFGGVVKSRFYCSHILVGSGGHLLSLSFIVSSILTSSSYIEIYVDIIYLQRRQQRSC